MYIFFFLKSWYEYVQIYRRHMKIMQSKTFWDMKYISVISTTPNRNLDNRQTLLAQNPTSAQEYMLDTLW